tara:strand:+ start:861 stop:1097 length:237 start_codon:yes stop_codon:yes gene_type:complete
MKIQRNCYIDTLSEAGSSTRVEFDSELVYAANSWTNSYGNPTTRLYLKDGRRLLCVDDYGALNDLSIGAHYVNRRKDL